MFIKLYHQPNYLINEQEFACLEFKMLCKKTTGFKGISLRATETDKGLEISLQVCIFYVTQMAL